MIKPMLCATGSLRDLRRQGYAGEDKFDGTRVVIEKMKGVVTLWNRNGINYTRRLPEIVAAAESTSGDFTIDVEVVYINPRTGKVEFTPCQSLRWIRKLFP